MPDTDLLRRLDVASEAATTAGVMLQQMQSQLRHIEEKQPGDLVTEADRASEAVILDILQRHFPHDQIIAEESGRQGLSDSLYCWAVDPLDGTTNYAHGYPMAAVSIGLLSQGEPVAGVIYDIFQGRLYRGGLGIAATRDRDPIQVSDTRALNRSLLVTGFAYDRRRVAENNYAEFCHFTHLSQGVRRGGAAALDLALVAAGHLDGYWERGLSVWDIAAGIAIVRAAGGKVTAYDGGPVDVMSGRLLASNGHLHTVMQTELTRVQPLNQVLP